MTITGANRTIRADIDAAAGRHTVRFLARYEQHALEVLEDDLERLHLAGYKQLPADYEFPAGVSAHGRRVIRRAKSIRAAIDRIFDDLMEQPLPEWNLRIAKHGFYPSKRRAKYERFSNRL